MSRPRRKAVRKLDQEVANNQISEDHRDELKSRLKKLDKRASEGDQPAKKRLARLSKKILRRGTD